MVVKGYAGLIEMLAWIIHTKMAEFEFTNKGQILLETKNNKLEKLQKIFFLENFHLFYLLDLF